MFKKIAAVFILFLGVVFFIIAKTEKKDVVHMPPKYRAEGFDGKDSIYHRVPDIALVNQMGDAVTMNASLSNRIVVINFFFSNCTTICTPLMQNMATLQKAFHRTAVKQNDTIAQLVSISVDQARDSFPALRQYANSLGADHDRWWLCTGDGAAIRNYARNELKVIAPEAAGEVGDLFHTKTIVVLDKQRRIRGYYNGLDTAEIMRCADDIGKLYIEKERKRR